MTYKRNSVRMNTVCDTIQAEVELNNDVNIDVISEEMRWGAIKRIHDSKFNTQTLDIKISMERALGGYEKTNSDKAVNKYCRDLFRKKLCANKKQVDTRRCDISVDTSLCYITDINILYYFFLLLTDHIKDNHKIVHQNLDTLRDNGMFCRSSSWDFTIYDKKLESKGRHGYDVRLEFRCKLYCLDNTTKSAEKFLRFVHNCWEYNDEITERFGNKLYNLYIEELSKGHVKKFFEFVKKNDIYFCSRDILEFVYKKTNQSRNFSDWLRYQKARNKDFNVVKFNEIKRFVIDIEKSIKKYIKS